MGIAIIGFAAMYLLVSGLFTFIQLQWPESFVGRGLTIIRG